MPDLRALLLEASDRMAEPTSDFDLNTRLRPGNQGSLKEAAVLVAITPTEDIILTRRTAHLKHHAGQIAFPGGRQDAEDPSLEHTALREAGEEIGLPQHCADVLAQLPPHETVSGYRITPILSLTSHFEPTLERAEVAELFTVPLAHLARRQNYRVEKRFWGGLWRHYYTVPWGPYYIWGATAQILHGIAGALDAH